MSTKKVPVKISENSIMYLEVERAPGEENVGIGDAFSLDGVLENIKEFGEKVGETLKKINPDKLSVEFGCDFTAKGGKLLTTLVDSEGKASIKVKLEWSK